MGKVKANDGFYNYNNMVRYRTVQNLTRYAGQVLVVSCMCIFRQNITKWFQCDI